MSAIKSPLKELFIKVKAMFDAPAPVVDPAAPATPTPTATPFKLKDGTDITIGIDDPTTSMDPDAGDIVMIAGAPAPAADYELDNGTKFTTDATGAITVVTPVVPVTQTAEEIAAEAAKNIPAVPAAPVKMSDEEIKTVMNAFATGTPEERVARLEIMVKALMECNFGWQIRQGQEAEAINTYKQSLAPVQTAVTAAEQKMAKHEGVIAGLFELVEKIVEIPTAEPKTLTGAKKDQFDRSTKREQALDGIAKAITEMKNKKKVNPAA